LLNLYDTSPAARVHWPDRSLRDVKKSSTVDAENGREVSSVYCANGLAMKMPALLTSVSMRPKRA
jgi:hypothetical protein